MLAEPLTTPPPSSSSHDAAAATGVEAAVIEAKMSQTHTHEKSLDDVIGCVCGGRAGGRAQTEIVAISCAFVLLAGYWYHYTAAATSH